MAIIIYGDFGCPYSYLASLRADQLVRSRAATIDWRAVARHRVPAAAGPRPDSGGENRDANLAAVWALARPGERLPRRPTGAVDVAAAVAAYAESVSDGVPDQLRRRLFAAIWTEARRVSTVEDVRQLIADVMCPPEPIIYHLISRDLPNALIHDPDVNRVMRRSGGTVTVYDDPLTTPGTRRGRRWQQEWLALPSPVVIDPDGAVLPRPDALRYLAAAVGVIAPPPPVLPAGSAAAGPEDRMASAVAGEGR
jgi:DSBA-like thioredoxin domain